MKRRVSQGHEMYSPWFESHRFEPWLSQTCGVLYCLIRTCTWAKRIKCKCMFNWYYWFKCKNFLMAHWSSRASQGHQMFYHDPDVMGSNPGWVKLGVCSTSIYSVALEPKIYRMRYDPLCTQTMMSVANQIIHVTIVVSKWGVWTETVTL